MNRKIFVAVFGMCLYYVIGWFCAYAVITILMKFM